MRRFSKIRLDAFAAGIEFRKTDDGRQVVLLCGLAKISLRLVNILGQSLPAEMHERRIVQAARLTPFGRLDEEPRGLRSIGRSAAAIEINIAERNPGPYVAVLGSLFVPFGASPMID